VRASHDLSRVSVCFKETSLVRNAGLLPAAVLAERLGLAGLIDARLRLAKHGANSGSKALSVIGSMLAGGDSIDDVTVLRAGPACEVLTWGGVDSRVGARTHSGPTSGSSTRSAGSCWSGSGAPAPGRPTWPRR